MRTLKRRQSLFRPLSACGVAVAALYAAFVLPNVRTVGAQSLPPLPSLSVSTETARPHADASPSPVPGAVSASAVSVQRIRWQPQRSAIATVWRDTTIYSERQVDRPARMDKPTIPLVYPAERRAAKKNGRLLVQFIVDTVGALEPGSLKMIKTDHQDFIAAVRSFLEVATFKPAMKGGLKVRQVVQMPFAFNTLGGSD